MRQHVLRYWLLYYLGIFVLAIFFLAGAVKRVKAEEIGHPYFGIASFCSTKQDRIDSNSEEIWDKYVAEYRCFTHKLPYVVTHILQVVEDDGIFYLVEIQVEAKGRWYVAYAMYDVPPTTEGFQLVHDTSEHPALAGWAEEQLITPEARASKRFACPEFEKTNNSCYCCHGSEIVKTKFRPVKGDKVDEDGWEWMNPKNGRWQVVPNDVIHWDEPTPTGEAVIFVLSGDVRCFFPPQDGGG